MKNRKAKKGFTIIELVIVIAVIGILAAVLIPTFSNVIENANKVAAKEAASNAYTQYLAATAGEGTTKSNVCIEVYDKETNGKLLYRFHVTNGSLDLDNDLATESSHTHTSATDWAVLKLTTSKVFEGMPTTETSGN